MDTWEQPQKGIRGSLTMWPCLMGNSGAPPRVWANLWPPLRTIRPLNHVIWKSWVLIPGRYIIESQKIEVSKVCAHVPAGLQARKCREGMQHEDRWFEATGAAGTGPCRRGHCSRSNFGCFDRATNSWAAGGYWGWHCSEAGRGAWALCQWAQCSWKYRCNPWKTCVAQTCHEAGCETLCRESWWANTSR